MNNDLNARMATLGLNVEDVEVAVFWASQLGKELKCLGSSIKTYQKGSDSSLYKHTDLIKILGTKSDLWTKELKEEIYNENQMSLVTLIINWDDSGYCFCYLNLKNEKTLSLIAKDFEPIKSSLQDYINEHKNG